MGEIKQEKEVKITKPVEVVQVATDVQELFQVNGEVMNLNQYLCWMGNILVEIKKGISG